MSKIKSALELALEKTEGVKYDKENLKADNSRKEGKKLAAEFLQSYAEGEPINLAKRLKDYSGKDLGWVKDGFFQVLVSNLILPLDESYTQRFQGISDGILEMVKDKKNAGHILKQINQFFSQYLANQKQLAENLEAQYAPKLRQKEKELARQLGTEIHLSPQSDPEFAGLLKKQLSHLEARYQEALMQVKEELKGLFQAAQ